MLISMAVGVCLGCAAMASRPFRYWFISYIVALLGLHWYGVPADGLAGDILVLFGWLILAFGVARGLVAIWETEMKK